MQLDHTVVFLGAGFSKASGLRTTRELAEDFLMVEPTKATKSRTLQERISKALRQYWTTVFNWKAGDPVPPLEDHFTLLDLAANTGHNLGSYTPKMLRAVRRLSIHRVFDLLDEGFKRSFAGRELITAMRRGEGNAIISTNWDTGIERYVVDRHGLYSYGLDTFSVNGERFSSNGIPLLKLHGSSNWMYCDACTRVFTGQPGGGKAALHSWTFLKERDLRVLRISWPNDAESRDPYRCHFCGEVELAARVATFSYRKALDFFQFQAVWDRALDALRTARRWLFVGYSLPQADFEIRRLLKSAELADGSAGPKKVIAVPGENPQAVDHYRRFFGRRVHVFPMNLDCWWRSECRLVLGRGDT